MFGPGFGAQGWVVVCEVDSVYRSCWKAERPFTLKGDDGLRWEGVKRWCRKR